MKTVLIQSLSNSYALEFERSDPTRKLRLCLSELLTLMAQSKEIRPETTYKSSELLDQEIYFDEVVDVLCVALAELSILLPITEVAEALLRTLHGPSFICQIVANNSGERYEEESFLGRATLETLRSLCRMCPNQILIIRLQSIKDYQEEMCRMPVLAVLLSLDYTSCQNLIKTDKIESQFGDDVPFISGLLLGGDANIRTWFSLFIRNGQKRHDRALHTLRQELLRSLQSFVQMAADEPLPDRCAVDASDLLRLYCALKGIAGIKLYDEEGELLLQLITCRPPPTEADLRFVALGLCMLMACPSLIALPEQEQSGFRWVKWLVREESYFEKSAASSSGKCMETTRSSFGEMLLLMAIHFHSGQLSAVFNLVCSTLGMRLLLWPASTSRMKVAFPQDIFPEKVVTSHAVRVPVTPGLNADVADLMYVVNDSQLSLCSPHGSVPTCSSQSRRESRDVSPNFVKTELDPATPTLGNDGQCSSPTTFLGRLSTSYSNAGSFDIRSTSRFAARTHLSRYLLDKPLFGPVAAQWSGNLAGVTSDSEREELKMALIAAQESSVVQIVLDLCLQTPEDEANDQRISEMREVQNIVCPFLHQLFIADPNLVILVHFQFALPRSSNIARLAVNTLSTLLYVLPSNGRTEIYLPALPALVRIATAFKLLVDDIVSFLVQLGRDCLSQSCLHGSYDHRIVSSLLRQLDHEMVVDEKKIKEEIVTPPEDDWNPMEVDTKK
ncbi:hypothetical protein DAPPUDRAFT_105173 [Daphnia pulex]|uniref:Uncharacterized protein n=1 Tax=Daphnia pulex TaxID=6669 RepID=E9GPQ4_DAPPU|nr:hypothetical protein DAPPUDRAFT_105173 [Daphnia pulex]|eukprot:EFX78427.1 hypothetical protein DAPPUDRAFT_105173 [Daphnia pulex]